MEISIDPIKQWLDYYIKFYKLPSISIGIINKSEVFTQSFGYYNKDKKVSADGHTKYAILSLSKIYTTIEVFKQIDKGSLKLTDKVKKYISEFPKPNVTIKNLLTHTAGIPRDGDYNFWIDKDFPGEMKLLNDLGKLKVMGKRKYKYSNLGFALLGIILSKLGVDLNQAKVIDAIGYNKFLFENQNHSTFFDAKAFTPSFGLYRSILELSNTAQSLLKKNSNLLSTESFKSMFKVYVKTKKDNDDIAMPWNKWKGKNIYDFSGFGFGFSSSILLDFEQDLAITVLSNSSEESNMVYVANSIRHYIKYFMKEKISVIESDKNGLYRCDDYDIIIFDCKDRIVSIKPESSAPFHPDNIDIYKKIGENKYSISNPDDNYADEFLTFTLDKNKKVVGVRHGGWGFRKINNV